MTINISQRQRSRNKFTAFVPNALDFHGQLILPSPLKGRLFKVTFTENWKVLCDIKSMQNRRRRRRCRRLPVNIIYTNNGSNFVFYLIFFPRICPPIREVITYISDNRDYYKNIFRYTVINNWCTRKMIV